MLKDGQLSDTEKQLINYFNSLPGEYRGNPQVLNLLESVISDGRVTGNELRTFHDWDGDGLSNLFEIKNGLNPLKPDPNVAYLLKKGLSLCEAKIVSPLDSDGVMQKDEKSFDDLLLTHHQLLIVSALKSYLAKQASDGKIMGDELEKSENFAYLVKQMYEDILNEPKSSDKIADTNYAAELALQLKFDSEKATKATAEAISEYSVAMKEESLPEQIQALQALTKLTQNKDYGSKLVDFSPITFKTPYSQAVISIDKPRDTWLLARHVKAIEDSNLSIDPKEFEALNSQVISDAWSIFDAKYGIAYIEKEVNHHIVKPEDSDVEQLMLLQWKLYSEASKGKYYNRDFPWYDSDKLDKLYADKNNRRIALFYFYSLPNSTWDMEKQEKAIGMKGAATALEQAFSEYQKISKLYPKGKVHHPIWGMFRQVSIFMIGLKTEEYMN